MSFDYRSGAEESVFDAKNTDFTLFLSFKHKNEKESETAHRTILPLPNINLLS